MRPLQLKILFLTAFAAALCGCGSSAAGKTGTARRTGKEEAAQQTLFAMDTVMTLTAYGPGGEEAVQKSAEEIRRIDALLSTGSDESEIGMLNRTGSGTLSGDARALVARSLKMAEVTDGAFDIAIYPIVEAWGFTKEEQRVPAEEELERLLPLCDPGNIVFDAESGEISFRREGMKIDLGGAAKGYTSARLMAIYRAAGVDSGLVNLGGNVQTLGRKPDGSRWRIAIEDPDDREKQLGVLELENKAAVTSGGYERYFEADGKRYHHIIDPETGRPAEKGLKSVTIVSEDGTLSDILSTSLFIMGTEKAQQFCAAHAEKDGFDAVLYTEDDRLLVTPGIRDSFETERKAAVMEGF